MSVALLFFLTCLNAGRPPVMVFQFCTVMDSTSEPGENDESDDDDEAILI